ncbi:MAG: aldolase [Heyndrickxia sp.]
MISLSQKKLYSAFGLTLQSEISFPELNQVYDIKLKEDIVIEKKNLNQLWNQLYDNKSKFITMETSVMFQVTDTAIFLVEKGKKIVVSPIGVLGDDKIRLFILGTCMSIVLMQRRILPLHGSAIEIDGKAYAFIGKRGAGKSTLASTFVNEGFKLISDDIVPILINSNKIPTVIPSYPQQKLWEESLFRLGLENHLYRPLFDRETKYAVPVQTSFVSEKLPLAGIFELIPYEEDNISFKSINSLEQFYTIYLHTFRNFLIPRLGLMEWHFETSSILLKNVKLIRVSRPNSWFSAKSLLELILNTIKQGE